MTKNSASSHRLFPTVGHNLGPWIVIACITLCLLQAICSARSVLRELDPSLAAAMVYYVEHTPMIATGWKTMFRLIPPFDVSDLAVAMLIRRLDTVIQKHLSATTADSCRLYADAMGRTIDYMERKGEPYTPDANLTRTSAWEACLDSNVVLPPWDPPASDQAKALRLAAKGNIMMRTDPALSKSEKKTKTK